MAGVNLVCLFLSLPSEMLCMGTFLLWNSKDYHGLGTGASNSD